MITDEMVAAAREKIRSKQRWNPKPSTVREILEAAENARNAQDDRYKSGVNDVTARLRAVLAEFDGQ